MNLNQITFPVVDMAQAKDFYQTMGFVLIVDTPHYVRFSCPQGGSTFSLVLSDNKQGNPTVIYFECEQLEKTVKELQEKGLSFAQLPTAQSYLWTEAILFDPSGNKIKLYWAGENRLNPPWKVKH